MKSLVEELEALRETLKDVDLCPDGTCPNCNNILVRDDSGISCIRCDYEVKAK